MSEISAFQVAREIVRRTDGQEVNSVALQKLCFFSFSWYAHLTGRRLYPEATWAMQRGPVIGELLTAHSGKPEVSVDLLDKLIDTWMLPREIEDSYAIEVIDSVFDAYYKHFDPWTLEKISHLEPTWKSAWDRRKGKRAAMPGDALQDYYLTHAPATDGVLEDGTSFDLEIDLPPRLVTVADSELLDPLLDAPGKAHEPFVERLLALR